MFVKDTDSENNADKLIPVYDEASSSDSKEDAEEDNNSEMYSSETDSDGS
jgi:hypothetical protein